MLILPKSPHYCFRAIRSLDTDPHFRNIDTYKADRSHAAELFFNLNSFRKAMLVRGIHRYAEHDEEPEQM